MHLLWVKTELLHPVDKGGRIRTYNILKALCKRHRVTYVALDDGTATSHAIDRASEYCHDLVMVPFSAPAKRSFAFFAALVRNLGSRLPYAIAKYRSDHLRSTVSTLSRSGSIDVVICDFLAPSMNVSSELPVPVVLFQHNVETRIWERHARVAHGWIRRAYMRRQWHRMMRHEKAECMRFDAVIAVSPEDKFAFSVDYGVRNVSDIPTGVDIEYFRPSGAEQRQRHELIFTGSMDWMPNEDAVQFFVHQILPLIRARIPDVTFTIAGRRPSNAILSLASTARGIHVTGSVPDIRPFIERSSVVVVPIRIGGGTRLKIYEAMAMERPVVSTTIGAEGLSLRHEVDFLAADDPADFANAVIALLLDQDRASAIAKTAAARVRAQNGWDRVAERFGEICADIARRPVERNGRWQSELLAASSNSPL